MVNKQEKTKKVEWDIEGMRDIADYVNATIPTVMRWTFSMGFPAWKPLSRFGIWVAKKSDVDKWRKKQGRDAAKKTKKKYIKTK
jgi:hypothetical protein